MIGDVVLVFGCCYGLWEAIHSWDLATFLETWVDMGGTAAGHSLSIPFVMLQDVS